MLALVLLGQEDSTGQRITFIVIGLLLAALLLAILTAWYYRVTDPGPSQGRRSRGAGGSKGGGQARTGPEPRPGPGWRKRLSGMSVPSHGEPAQPVPANERVEPARRREEVPPAGSSASARSSDSVEKVSLEGGYYLDLTAAPQSAQPPTNVGSLNSLDLRQPAPLIDPTDQAPVPVPTVPEPQARRTQPGPSQPAQQPQPAPPVDDGGLSFDEWLAEVEASEDQ